MGIEWALGLLNSFKRKHEPDFIRRSYPGIHGVHVTVADEGISLGTDDHVSFDGYSRPVQHITHDGVHTLHVEKFNGSLLLPDSHLTILIESEHGKVSGVIRTPGTIKTKTGAIDLLLDYPLNVLANTKGPLLIDGMEEKNNFYFPPGLTPTHTLTLESKTGGIRVEYVGPHAR